METVINPQERITRLIDAATDKAGGQNAMARRIGYTHSEVSQWRHGRPCPVEAQALMAELAGLDAHEVLAYAIIEKHRDTPKGERLATVLGKASSAIKRAGFFALCVSAAWVFSPQPAHAHTSYDV